MNLAKRVKFILVVLLISMTVPVFAAPLTPPNVAEMQLLGGRLGFCAVPGAEDVAVVLFGYDPDPADPLAIVETFTVLGESHPFGLYDSRGDNGRGFVWYDADRDGTYDGGYPVVVPAAYWTPMKEGICGLLRGIVSGRVRA